MTGQSLVPSSFYDRFTVELTRLLRALVKELLGRLARTGSKVDGALSMFEDVLAADATVVKLHRLLAGRYPGTRSNSSPAAAKLHLVMSVKDGGAQTVKVTGERASDHRTLRMGPWVRGRLLMFDLGFFRYQLFDCIDRNGGYFLTRLQSGANPKIVATHRRWRGRSIDLEGVRLSEVADRLRREVLDVEVEVAFKRRVYSGIRRTARRTMRLVGVRLPGSREYRFYLTNVGPEEMSAEDVARAYAARWQIELIFKELKSHYRLDQLPSSKAHIVEALLLSAVITLLVSRRLLAAVREKLRRERKRVPEQRWAAVFAAAASEILSIVVLAKRHAKAIASRLEPILLHEAADPNRNRKLLLERIDSRCLWAGVQ